MRNRRWRAGWFVSAAVVGSLLLTQRVGSQAPGPTGSRVVVTGVGAPSTDRGLDVTSEPQGPGLLARHVDLPGYSLAQARAGDGLSYVPGRLIVKYRAGTGSPARLAAMTSIGATSTERLSYANFDVLQIDEGEDPEAAAQALRERADVEYAQAAYRISAAFRPNDPMFGEQWNMQALEMEQAWDINEGATSSVTVAVIDTGVAWRNQIVTRRTVPLLTEDGRVVVLEVDIPFGAAQDLASNGRFVAPRDFNWNDNNPADWDGHGTHVTGSAGQLTNNGFGVSGMAFNVQIMPVKMIPSVLEATYFNPPVPSTDDTLARAIRYAVDNGANVINMSLGRSGGPGAPVVLDALQYAVSRGVFCAIAAGNSFEDGNPVEWPAAYGPQIDGVVTVAALGRGLTRSFFSSTGFAEIAAPGGDQRAGGLTGGILQQTYDQFQSENFPPRFDVFRFRYFQGTSMATPHVSGFAALLYQQGIRSPAAIEAAMKQFARDVGATGTDTETGAGMIQPRDTLLGLGLNR